MHRVTGYDMNTITVLIIDSHPTFRDSLAGFLEAQGGMTLVGTAMSGQEGVVLAAKLRPDVVLIDLAMPDLPGLTPIPMLRTVAPESVIIALSTLAADAEAYRAAAVATGADDFVPKSKVTTELVPAIQRAMARKA